MNKKAKIITLSLIGLLLVSGLVFAAYQMQQKKAVPNQPENSNQTPTTNTSSLQDNMFYLAEITCGNGLPNQQVLFLTNPEIREFTSPVNYPVDDTLEAEEYNQMVVANDVWGIALNLSNVTMLYGSLNRTAVEAEFIKYEDSACKQVSVYDINVSSLVNPTPRASVVPSTDFVTSLYGSQAYASGAQDMIYLFLTTYEDEYSDDETVYNTTTTQSLYLLPYSSTSTEALKAPVYKYVNGSFDPEQWGNMQIVDALTPDHLAVDVFYCDGCGLENYKPYIVVINHKTGKTKYLGEVGDLKVTPAGNLVSYRKVGTKTAVCNEDQAEYFCRAYDYFLTGERITTELP